MVLSFTYLYVLYFIYKVKTFVKTPGGDPTADGFLRQGRPASGPVLAGRQDIKRAREFTPALHDIATVEIIRMWTHYE
jgi:hypothetical protein